ncbi:uncharacterized protein SPPG_04998 [Spizellomyces punctatus DAOM BR117]|uniref:Uncharacterized protein n=1 Tax=Spizellomyces punctatus (strain DAOM BR117) TaxID=645134 RepID=A0A0L0HF19_SPIPD|nr:uncharacterized protein SPPG_04998 [Spizellomyces punctatus DAOM BR117]KNC99611.1 hypothetical protein SPPG_04998 [Spizellomyces punctatus DAOM BR117]|eukprot:XP_016607651.1 hypothetical protein SPPG_04998 [Spizellomyces punctatus DAOM BR117]
MPNYKPLIQHCRALLSLHHDFARKSFGTGLAGIHDVGSTKTDVQTDDDGIGLDFKNPVVRTEEEILDDYCKEHQVTDDAERTFLEEVFNGCVRQRKALEVALFLFYTTTGGRYLRNEYNLFAALFYLALFRLEDLSFPKLRAILLSYDPAKMARFVGFLFDDAMLQGKLREGWAEILDAEWVKERMIDPLLRNMENGISLAGELCDKAEKGMVPKKGTKAPTEPEPFLLTRPRPRALPEPTEIVSNVMKARPVPRSVYQGSGEREALEKIKAEKREQLRQIYLKASQTQFSVAIRKPLSKTGTLREEQNSPPPRTHLHRPVPANLRSHVPVKLTAAAILREDALVRRQKQEEEAWLNEVEMGLRDGGDFKEWREDARAKEQEERRIELERRHLEIQLIHEEAYEAKQELLKENRERAAEILAERESLRMQAEATRKQQELLNKKIVEEVQEIQECVQKAKQKVVENNSRKAAEIIQQKVALKEQAERDAEEERARKAELIAQIRLLERCVPPVGSIVKSVDPTETSGLGLLGEMSLVELQERLVLAKHHHQEQETHRRQEIRTQKQTRLDLITQKLAEIDREREERRRRRKQREREGVSRSTSALSTSSEDTRDRETDPVLLQLRKKLSAKRAARLGASQKRPSQTLTTPSTSRPSLGSTTPSSLDWQELDDAEREYERKRRVLDQPRIRILKEMEGEMDTLSEGIDEDNANTESGWGIEPVAVVV